MILKTEALISMTTKEITMTINEYKIRVADDLTKTNDVICFDYIQSLPSGYVAISYEKYYDNREEGFFDILKNILLTIHIDDSQMVYYYNEFSFLLDDTKINRHKGYWGLKPYKSRKYDFLSCKAQSVLTSGTQLKMKGVAKLDMDELKMLIHEVSYQERSFFFCSPHLNYNIKDFISDIEGLMYSEVMNYVLNDDGVVFILLGDEDCRTSEVVVIAKPKIINILRRVAFSG